MKVFKRIIVWVLISLLLQTTIYLYLDKFYFIDEKNVKVTEIKNNVKKVNVTANVTFPGGANEIELSFDGNYTSYFDINKNFVVVETNSGKLIDIPFNYHAKCIAYKWLPDSDIILLAEELPAKKGQVIRFYSFDIEKSTKKDIGDPNIKGSSISINDVNIKVDIEVSTLTGIMYVKCFSIDTSSKIYRIDRNETMTKISTRINKIGTIKVASHDDLLAYEDLNTHQIRTTMQKKAIVVEESSDLFLLAADGNDNMYIGKNINGLVNKIYYGKLSDQISLWKSISLDKPINPQDTYISYNGEIYLKEEQGGLLNLKSNKKLLYDGKFLGVYNNYIASENNGRLILK